MSLQIVTNEFGDSPPAVAKVFVSYTWGDSSPNASEDQYKRQDVVERMCEMLNREGWEVVRDKTALRYGDMISTFMQTLSQADLVIVVLSAKYLRSPYCMTELHTLYQNSRQAKHDFLDHIIPLILADARVDSWRDRAEHAKHWQAEFQAMEQSYQHLGEQDFRLYKAMKDWHNHVSDMLAHVNDVLSPHGFDAIVEDDFGGLRQMLRRASIQKLGTRPGRQTMAGHLTKSEELPQPRNNLPIRNASITSSFGLTSSRSHIVVSALLPYLVNRIEQEREMRDALELHSTSNSRRPILFLLYGRAEQAIHHFLDRVQKSSVPRILRRLSYPDVLNWHNRPWPRADWQTNGERLIRNLRDDLADALELPPQSWPDSFVDAAAQKRVALIFCYRVRWETWSNQHLQAIRMWAEDWASVPNLAPTHPTLLFFVTEYETIKLGIAKRLLRLDRNNGHPIHKQLCGLRDLDGPRLTVRLLPELANVTLDDVQDWILTEVRPPNPAGLIRLARQILDNPELTTTGVPMEYLADRLLKLLLEASASQGVNA